MSVSYTTDLTSQWKQNVYHINLEVGQWDTVTIQVIEPESDINVYGTLNNGQPQGQSLPSGNYGAANALDWASVQCVKLATGNAQTNMDATGLYSIPVNSQFIRLEGKDVYALYQWNQKLG